MCIISDANQVQQTKEKQIRRLVEMTRSTQNQELVATINRRLEQLKKAEGVTEEFVQSVYRACQKIPGECNDFRYSLGKFRLEYMYLPRSLRANIQETLNSNWDMLPIERLKALDADILKRIEQEDRHRLTLQTQFTEPLEIKLGIKFVFPTPDTPSTSG